MAHAKTRHEYLALIYDDELKKMPVEDFGVDTDMLSTAGAKPEIPAPSVSDNAP